jgi:asparagine synthase (glutamine-hydrolysing)
VTVVLSGDGGDELFAGYQWLHMALRAGKFASVPRPLRALLDVGLLLAPGTPWWNRVRRFNSDASLPAMERLRRRETCFSPDARADLYSPSLAAAVHARALDRFREFWDESSGLSDADRMLRQDLRMYLPGDILTKVDRMSMAASLEARVPLLDHRIVEFAATVPFEMKYNGGTSKRLVKRALRGIVPDELLEQRKRGFAIPVHAWFRGALRSVFEETVLHPDARSLEWFEPAAMRSLLDTHLAGRENLGHHLWALLVFEHWLRWVNSVPGVRVTL